MHFVHDFPIHLKCTLPFFSQSQQVAQLFSVAIRIFFHFRKTFVLYANTFFSIWFYYKSKAKQTAEFLRFCFAFKRIKYRVSCILCNLGILPFLFFFFLFSSFSVGKKKTFCAAFYFLFKNCANFFKSAMVSSSSSA